MSVGRITVKVPYPIPLETAGNIGKALSEYFPDAVVLTSEPDYAVNMTILLNPEADETAPEDLAGAARERDIRMMQDRRTNGQ